MRRYALHEPLVERSPARTAQQRAAEAAQRISHEASQFTRMMFELWDEDGTGELTPPRYAPNVDQLARINSLECLLVCSTSELVFHSGTFA